MICIRRTLPEDLPRVQNANLTNLPENYSMKYYYYHLISNPNVSFLAETEDKKVVGYCLVKVEKDNNKKAYATLTSISVLRSYRRLGIATKLLRAAENSLIEQYQCEYFELHVRESNKPARHLYEQTIGFKIHVVEKKYYADGEDGIIMRHYLNASNLLNKVASSPALESWIENHPVPSE